MSRRRRSGTRKGKGRAAGGAEFWGHDPTGDDGVDDVAPATDPTAMVKSLGPVPLPGREHVAEHYFVTVYERASGLATALAVAADLLPHDTDL